MISYHTSDPSNVADQLVDRERPRVARMCILAGHGPSASSIAPHVFGGNMIENPSGWTRCRASSGGAVMTG
jgi:hypothetical protein